MNILGCLDTPTSGEYFLNKQDVSKLNDNELAHIRKQGNWICFPDFQPASRSTALDNVMLPQIYAGIAKTQR